MVFFKDLHENGQSYICVTEDQRIKAVSAKHKFPVHPSMLHGTTVDPTALKEGFPKELTACLDVERGGPAYVLKSSLEGKETESVDSQPPMLGRRIIRGTVRWGLNLLKIPGEFTYIPRYWEWTEDVIARYAARLKNAHVYDVVYASLYSYDREPNVMRAFCESWCSRTNTLHTEAGEWSLSLWDLYRLGGLPILGHLYDEAIPSFKDMNTRNTDGTQKISRACTRLFGAYCFLADQSNSKNGVRASQWIQFWCKRAEVYEKLPSRRTREADNPPPKSYNPTGEISRQSLDWTSEELDVFTSLGIADDAERKTTYLAAFLSCWLCVFALPERDERLIRPGTFEVATQMARGATFSLATPVLASIYHGLNKMVGAEKPSSSGSIFPAHYVYGWLAHYFGTHHELGSAPLGPMMARYSGHQGAKYYTDVAARKLIHEGSSFKASSLVLSRNKCESVYDNNSLSTHTTSYIIALRTAYLPLRSRTSFFLEPYHPVRFSRQFGFYQEIPGELSRDADDGHVPYDIALKHLRMLLFTGSQTKMVLPGFALNWKDLTTDNFKQWWRRVTVTDLRKNVGLLLSSVDFKGKNKADGGDNLRVLGTGVNSTTRTTLKRETAGVRSGKRAADYHSGNDERDINFKHRRVEQEKRDQLYSDLFDGIPDPSDGHACLTLDDVDFDLANEVPKLISEPLLEVVHQRPAHGMGKQIQRAVDSSSSCKGSHASKQTSVDLRATSSSSSDRAIGMTSDIRNAAVMMMKRLFLQNLKGAPYDQVENVATSATGIYESIQSLDGDTSSLRAIVDAYVRSVAALLMTQKDTPDDGDQLAHDISKVETSLQSAQVAFEAALQINEAQEAQLSSLTEKKAALEASLQAMHEEETSLKEQHHQQLEVATAAKSKVASLQQELEDLRASQAKINKLKKIQCKLDKCREDLDAAMC